MNIQILDRWLRDHIKTSAKPDDIAKYLSLSSVSVERVEKVNNDYLYDIEITTNRVDLMSAVGLARELSAVLLQNGFTAEFREPKANLKTSTTNEYIDVEFDKNLINRITAIVLEVSPGESPEFIKNRIEKSGINSHNNLIDITNYVMREMGHPVHAFDYDRLNSRKLKIRESKKGEEIVALDDQIYTLPGGDIVAEDGNGRIVDLLGIKGLANSGVTDDTKRILLFFDNNNPIRIRRTSLALGIRSDAAILNEKGVDPELIIPTMNRAIELYGKYASGKKLSSILDIYPNKVKAKPITVSKEKIVRVIGVDIKDTTVKEILQKLSFEVIENEKSFKVTPPSFRVGDIGIEEDIIEEIARIYGYDKIPNSLPPINNKRAANIDMNPFYWEERIKNAMKYWGFNEVYTYSMVSEELFEGPLESSVKIANPLSEDHVYMRTTLVPSLLEVIRENYAEDIKIFEIANVYLKRKNDLPNEKPHFAGIIKKTGGNIFLEAKGLLEALMNDLGIVSYEFRKRNEGGAGTDIFIDNKQIGDIELLEEDLVNFEIDFEKLIDKATSSKKFTPIPEYPPVIEDIRIEPKKDTTYKRITDVIYSTNSLIKDVKLIDEYEDKQTFRITFQDKSKSLSNEDIAPIREKIMSALKTKLRAKVG